jgi:transposase-like protein
MRPGTLVTKHSATPAKPFSSPIEALRKRTPAINRPRSNNEVRSCGRPSSTQFTAKFSGPLCPECTSSRSIKGSISGRGTETQDSIANGPDCEFMTTVIFACPKCGLVHEVTQVQVRSKKSGRFDCVDCGATIHSWYGVFDYSGCRAVRMDRGRGNAALILRLQILRHSRDHQIQGDVAEPRHRKARQRGKLA